MVANSFRVFRSRTPIGSQGFQPWAGIRERLRRTTFNFIGRFKERKSFLTGSRGGALRACSWLLSAAATRLVVEYLLRIVWECRIYPS